MKTILCFNQSVDKRKVQLRHRKDTTISRETRNSHIEITDLNGNKILTRNYIVIRFPKSKKVQWEFFNLRNSDAIGVGYHCNETEHEMELLFYDEVTFAWNLYMLEKMGLFKVSQRVIPDEEVPFSFYINARGIREWSYNIFYSLLQFGFEFIHKYFKRKSKEGIS